MASGGRYTVTPRRNVMSAWIFLLWWNASCTTWYDQNAGIRLRETPLCDPGTLIIANFTFTINTYFYVLPFKY